MLSVITDISDLEEIRAEWSELWRNDPSATPFQSPEWLLPWWRHLFGGGQLWTVIRRREGQLVSLLPLFRWGDRNQNLSFMGTGITDYLDIIGEPVDSIPGDWETADLDGIRSMSTLLHLGTPEICGVCPCVELPANMDELLGRIEPKLAVDIRRSSNRLTRAGNLTVERTSDPQELFSLHQSRWRERQKEGMFAADATQKFHRDVAAGFEKLGILRLYLMRLDGNAIGAIYAFTHRARTYAYLSGFDPAHAKLSPGTSLLAHVVQDAIQEGVQVFDFLRDGDGYKYRWGAQDTSIFRLKLAGNR